MHESICFSRPKEPNLFLEEDTSSERIAEVFSHALPGQLKGEGSQRYTMRDRFPQLAERLYRHNPEAKLIFIARHPLERAISHFKMIDRDVDLEIAINDIFTCREWVRHHAINPSLYFYQISPFIKYFPLENIKILWFEDFILNKTECLKALYSFLNLDPLIPELNIQRNAAVRRGRTTPLYRFLNQLPIFNTLKQLVPPSTRDRYRKYLKIKFAADRKYKISDEIQNQFERYIEDDLHAFLEFANAPQWIADYYLQSNQLGTQHLHPQPRSPKPF